jgi:hypothetical protein
MLHFDEQLGMYTLVMKGASISFYSLSVMITFAQKHYGVDLLTILN